MQEKTSFQKPAHNKASTYIYVDRTINEAKPFKHVRSASKQGPEPICSGLLLLLVKCRDNFRGRVDKSLTQYRTHQFGSDQQDDQCLNISIRPFSSKRLVCDEGRLRVD